MFSTNNFAGPGNPAITAGQAAAIAVARLQLPTIAPGIGPSPDLNPWNMAAVEGGADAAEELVGLEGLLQGVARDLGVAFAGLP